MQIVLVEPEIPPNTGNIARLCAATNTPLHLVEPLGFRLTDSRVRRAGLDYWNSVTLVRHPSLRSVLNGNPRDRLFFFSKHGIQSYWDASFGEDACLIFGSETRGLPDLVFEDYPERIWTIPMQNSAVRSLNLSNAVAIILYEALRQQHTRRL